MTMEYIVLENVEPTVHYYVILFHHLVCV